MHSAVLLIHNTSYIVLARVLQPKYYINSYISLSIMFKTENIAVTILPLL